MSKQATSTSILRNSTCRDLGHDWKPSLSQTYRTCQRNGCRTAERLIDGTWTLVTRSQRPRTKQTALDTVAPAHLWTMPLDVPREMSMPYPGYDKHRERHMEQRYYKAIADDHYYRATHTQHQQRGGH
jgi:hypothetical protein